MAEKKTEPQVEAPSTDVLSQLTSALTALEAKITSIETKIATPPEPKKEVPAPAPVAPAPRATADEQTRYVNDLRMYAAKQTQDAARYRIATEFGVDPKDIQGDYPDEAAMRVAAKQLADISRLEKLTKETQAKLEQMAKAPTPVDEETLEDTGGPSGPKLTPAQEVDGLYKEAKDARNIGAYLEAIYQDRRKVLGRGPASEPRIE